MAVADEMAWEPRQPWIHPKIVRYRRRGKPTMQPVPERFNIVVPDLLATLTFDPVLGPNPRNRRLARRPMTTETIFDPVSHLSPIVWEPNIRTGTRRTRREVRRYRNQSSLEPVPQGVIAAQRMTWMPSLPTRTRRHRLRPRPTGVSFELEFSVLATGVLCTSLANELLAGTSLITVAISPGSMLTNEALVGTSLINEDLC